MPGPYNFVIRMRTGKFDICLLLINGRNTLNNEMNISNEKNPKKVFLFILICIWFQKLRLQVPFWLNINVSLCLVIHKIYYTISTLNIINVSLLDDPPPLDVAQAAVACWFLACFSSPEKSWFLEIIHIFKCGKCTATLYWCCTAEKCTFSLTLMLLVGIHYVGKFNHRTVTCTQQQQYGSY